ncbi:MAG: toll/interleukin-1 receptor domain-containing protein [Clostridia bacterium]|nr:toll/interleukin-1 receptor domain-containing protein [Clostridia bacterium]
MEKTKVLYWADFKKSYSRHLIKKLQEINPSLEFTILDHIVDILSPNVDVFDYQIVMIQVTDVTKFSASESEREKIGELLEEFADEGNKLIVSHDVVYRRTRNEVLQEMYHYKINNFARENNVKYTKTSYCKQVEAFSSLPSVFSLADGELCWGDISQLQDKKIFFDTVVVDPQTGKRLRIPLVFGKIYGGGQLIWFNTGDAYDEPPAPITELDENFVKLLAECISVDLNSLKKPEYHNEEILAQLHKCDFSKPFSFICYSAADSSRVYQNCLVLDKLGVNYFLDFKNITSATPGSEGWKENVHEALDHENCTSAFVFMSEDFLNSSNCFYELQKMNAFEKKFVPILLGVSMDMERTLEIIQEWDSLTYEEKIKTFKDILAIRKKENNGGVQINQLVYHCHRDLRHFKNVQLVETILENCNLQLSDSKEYFEKIDEILEACDLKNLFS